LAALGTVLSPLAGPVGADVVNGSIGCITHVRIDIRACRIAINGTIDCCVLETLTLSTVFLPLAGDAICSTTHWITRKDLQKQTKQTQQSIKQDYRKNPMVIHSEYQEKREEGHRHRAAMMDLMATIDDGFDSKR
jgi:hypothetical protein